MPGQSVSAPLEDLPLTQASFAPLEPHLHGTFSKNKNKKNNNNTNIYLMSIRLLILVFPHNVTLYRTPKCGNIFGIPRSYNTVCHNRRRGFIMSCYPRVLRYIQGSHYPHLNLGTKAIFIYNPHIFFTHTTAETSKSNAYSPMWYKGLCQTSFQQLGGHRLVALLV